MKTSVVAFPGSNCDDDVVFAIRNALDVPVTKIWHTDGDLPEGTDLVVLPGGFSYGDYLRSGAMAARSPIMAKVREHAERGGLVVGICNGFQVLTESGLLPGVLMTNREPGFICRKCTVRVERTDTPFTGLFRKGQVVQFPIAHNEGLFYLRDDELKALEDAGNVVFRYCSETGEVAEEFSPNGALNNIAGIVSSGGNVLGLMPHPERASEVLLGGDDGVLFWRSIQSWVDGRKA